MYSPIPIFSRALLHYHSTPPRYLTSTHFTSPYSSSLCFTLFQFTFLFTTVDTPSLLMRNQTELRSRNSLQSYSYPLSFHKCVTGEITPFLQFHLYDQSDPLFLFLLLLSPHFFYDILDNIKPILTFSFLLAHIPYTLFFFPSTSPPPLPPPSPLSY